MSIVWQAASASEEQPQPGYQFFLSGVLGLGLRHWSFGLSVPATRHAHQAATGLHHAAHLAPVPIIPPSPITERGLWRVLSS
jgi:hypothetical protein